MSSRSQSIYTIKDDVSQELINDINLYNEVLYKKIINPKKKKKHEKLKERLADKLQKKKKKYGNDFKTLVTLGVTDKERQEDLIIALQKDSSLNGSIINPFTLGGKTKKMLGKKRKKTMKRGGGGDELDSVATTLSKKRIKPNKGIFSLTRKELRNFMKEVSKSRKSLPKKQIDIILEESHNTTRKNKRANKKGQNVKISEQDNKIQMIETRKELKEK